MKNNLRKLRKAKGLTLKQVADTLGTSNQQISRLETNKGGRLNEDWIEKLCKFYRVGVAELLGEDTPTTPSRSDVIMRIATEAAQNGHDPIKALDIEFRKWSNDFDAVKNLLMTMEKREKA